MLAYTELLRAEPADAERHTAEALASGPAVSSPLLQFGLQAVQGAAVFDLGDRVDGLAELQRSRSDFGDHEDRPRAGRRDGDAGVPVPPCCWGTRPRHIVLG
jgi:LuxR family maltose regulon positive regulatory protein